LARQLEKSGSVFLTVRLPETVMKSVALPLPAALTPAARAAEIAAILAAAKVDLGFLPDQRVYATPYHRQELP
jgi:hypothetical protein